MMTALTGQAVFDPFAPPPSTSPQPVVSNPVVTDQITQNSTQQVAPSAPQADDNTPTQVNVTPLNHPFQTNVQADDFAITPPANLDQPDSQTSDVSAIDISNDSNAAPFAQVPDSTTVDLVDEPDDVPIVAGVPEISYQPINQDALQPDSDQQQDFDLTEDERIALLDQVLTEVEQSASVFDQVVPSAILANDPLNPQGSGGSPARKPETVSSNSTPQEAGLIGQVEYEPSSELPVEVEGFLERVDEHADKLPQEIVVADGNLQALPQSHPTQTVIVLPITEEEGQTQPKNVKLSITWLIEWSHKIIKKFVGKVVYRHEPNL